MITLEEKNSGGEDTNFIDVTLLFEDGKQVKPKKGFKSFKMTCK